MHHLIDADRARDSVADELETLDRRIGSALRKALAGALVAVLLSVGSALLMGARWQEATTQQVAHTEERVTTLEAAQARATRETAAVGAQLARLSAQMDALQRELAATRQDVRELRAAVTTTRRRR